MVGKIVDLLNCLLGDVAMTKNILVCSPDSGKIASESQFFAPPLGVMRLVGYLNSKGHCAEYYDPNLYVCNKKGPSLDEKISEKSWDIIGFSLLDETLTQDIQNIYLAYKLCPNARLVAGGIEAQFNYQTILDKTPCRIVILGEGEVPMRMIADGEPLEKIPGIVVRNNAVALSQELFDEATQTIPWESIKYEDYWDVYKKMYGEQWNLDVERQVNTVRIFSRNRCPIGCKYCSSTFQLTLATDGKVPVRSASEESLISVIDRVVASHPDVRMIYLTDDDFVIDKRSVVRFCRQVIDKNYDNLTFMCFARITDLTEEVISWMSRANFSRLNIGVESFSQNVLNEVGKRCDVDRIHKALALLKKYKIKPFMNIIMTTPQSTLEDVEESLNNIIHYLEDDYYTSVAILGIQPLKGTEFYESYWDFKSHVVPIEGTNLKLRRDDYIYAEDPMVREFQIRWLAQQESVMKEYVEKNNIRHANNAKLALVQYQLAWRIVQELKEEFAETGSFEESGVIINGAGRLYENSPLSNVYLEKSPAPKSHEGI